MKKYAIIFCIEVINIMNIKVNGESKELNEKISITQLLKSYNIKNMNAVVVELNGEIIESDFYEGTMINDNDMLEVVSFVGGG